MIPCNKTNEGVYTAETNLKSKQESQCICSRIYWCNAQAWFSQFLRLMFIEFHSQISFLFFKIIHTKHDVFVSAYHYDMKIAQWNKIIVKLVSLMPQGLYIFMSLLTKN